MAVTQTTTNKVWCPDVAVAKSPFGDGAYALRDFKKGELIETGLVRRVPLDGNAFEMVFTWSEDRTVWGTGSGAAMFYNTSLDSNTHMERHFDTDNFEIYAIKDIKAGEALTHQYKSLQWRKVFKNDLPQPGTDHTDSIVSMPIEILKTKVECNSVEVNDHAIAVAARDIKAGEVVEYGLARIAPIHGSTSPYLFCWSEDESKWAIVSGCLMFYTFGEGQTNVVLERNIDEMKFTVKALRDIPKGGPMVLEHPSRPANWRTVFEFLKSVF